MNASQPSFAAALSTASSTSAAVAEVCDATSAKLGGPPDLALLFCSHHHGPDFASLAAAVCQRLKTDQLLGCTGESIVGTGREVENDPALSLWAARLPGARSTLMHLQFERTPDGGSIVGWPESLDAPWPEGSVLLMLGEPFSFPADSLLARLNEDRPDALVVGGMASGGAVPGENALLLGREAHDEGAVAVLLDGSARVRTLVSQGCRPIGKHFVITKAEQNVIQELGGKPALLRLKEVFDELPNREQLLVQQGLHVGRVVSEYQDRFEQGDFLVRNVMGIDPDSGAIAVGDYFRAGQTVQFHVRDAETADDELRQLLAAARDAGPSAAALLFTCNGRGVRLFGRPHHDAACIAAALGDIPLAGFFAQGELGPIGGQNFMHGFTASVAIFGGK